MIPLFITFVIREPHFWYNIISLPITYINRLTNKIMKQSFQCKYHVNNAIMFFSNFQWNEPLLSIKFQKLKRSSLRYYMYISTYQRDFLVGYTTSKNSQRLYSPRINFWEQRILPHRFLPHTPPTYLGSISAVFNPQVKI